MSFLNLFGGGDKSSNSTTSSNTSNTSSKVDSHNIATNTSVNSTSNNTSTLTQDRRLVVDSGSMGISADNSTIATSNSNNSTTNNNTYNTTTDYGAVNASIAANTAIAGKAIDVSQAVVSTGRDMMQANIDFLQHVSDGTQAEARAAISEVAAATGNAINQVVGIAAKPLNAQDPQHILVIVGLVVLGAVIFTRK